MNSSNNQINEEITKDLTKVEEMNKLKKEKRI